MIPGDRAHLSNDTTSGEKALYNIIKKHTPDNWICYVGQRLSTGSTPDFLIIGPDLGIVILEEKNIPINLITEFTTESWTVVRDGIPQKSTHPLRQARSYVEKSLDALKKYNRLKDNKGRLKFVVMHGVVLSAISRNDLAQASIYFNNPPINTFETSLVICSNELPSNKNKKSFFEQQIRNMSSLFKFENLDDDDIQTIRGALYPEIRARVLADALLDRGEALQALTIKQEQMARGIGRNDTVPHRLLKGVAGCGKSIILKTRVMEVARENPEWNILVTFYTRSLKKYLGNGFPPNVAVATIGQVLYQQSKNFHQDNVKFNSDSDEFCNQLTDYLSTNNISQGKYQAIFADEIQDISSSQIKFLRHLLDESTNCAFFCGDDYQNIFGKTNKNWRELGFKFQGRTSSMDLSSNFRNTKQIIEFALNFIRKEKKDKEDNLTDISIDPYDTIDCKRLGPKPVLREYSDSNDEFCSIVAEIIRLTRSERVSYNSICIIHPKATTFNQNEIIPLFKQLQHEDIPFYWLSEGDTSKIEYDPQINKITVTTPNSAKGLEWDIVFILSINNYMGSNPDSLRFVSATRARDILYPSTVGK